jgi:hypothetical protein
VENETSDCDSVNHPSHYTQGKIECIDAIESALGFYGFRCFLQGQVIKYNWRLGLKGEDAIEDARKAQWYQDKLVSHLTKMERESQE